MRTALATLFVVALASTASANGRDPYTSSIHWKRGGTQDIVVGMTFGLVISHDGGATWNWMCEKAVGYGGNYDPDYEYMASGAIFATTFDGLKVMRDGCTFTATPPGMTFVSRDEQASDGTFYFAASDATDSKIYKSAAGNDGMTFTSATPPGGLNNDWWQSIETAPSVPNDVYITGYRLVMKCTSNSGNPGTPCTSNTMCTNGGTCDPQKEFLLYKSTDAGANFTTMTMSGIGTTSQNSTIDIVGIDPATPSTLYVKVTLETGSIGDSIYRSTNSGATWTKIFTQQSKFGLAFLVRNDGSCVAGTRELGAWKATTCSSAVASTTGAPLGSFTALAGAPHIGCLYEGPAPNYEVWACTQNTAVPQLGVDADNYGIMKSTNLTTWTGVLKYQDIQAPVDCPLQTGGDNPDQQYWCVQRYMDMQSPWCCLVPQLGITSTAVDCSGALGCFNNTVDGAIDAGTTQPPSPKGCCDAGSGSSAMLGTLVVVGLVARRRKRRR